VCGVAQPVGAVLKIDMPNENERYVLFADILGFADFIETQEDLPHDDRWQQEILLSRPKSIQKPGVVNYRIRESWFISFHRAVYQVAARGVVTLGDHTVVAFSDSVFVMSDKAEGVLAAARALMRLCLGMGVPVRMGIGYGAWRELRFSSAFTRRIRNHAAQFLGSGVVRAYRAESRGGKGMRIFVHHSAAGSFQSLDLVRLPTSETSPHASHEVNYFKKPRRQSKNYLDERMPNKDILLNLDGLREMFPEKRAYYNATFAAIKRMRNE